MSRWPWSTTTGAFSRPGVAGYADHEVPAGVLPELDPLLVGPLAHMLDRRLLPA